MKRLTFLSLTALMFCITTGVNAQIKSSTPEKPIAINVEGAKSFGKEPLYVVDGKVVGVTLSGLSPDQIESLTVLKDASAFEQYGKEGGNGVILITTKNKPEEKIDLNNIIIRGNGVYGKKPLMVLNGEILDQTGINELDPNKIQSVTVLKDASAIALYGKGAENGVIVIVTKKETPAIIKN
ncbi:TonB-dependent receptor plug domain-containing protein [Pedobacter sp. Du54]|uniref:TonB-dependent receptor plug domain-containing protein n=1 Tax=Pedobacter anseongensis TaxID=3133439 RepID=UPI0030B5505B